MRFSNLLPKFFLGLAVLLPCFAFAEKDAKTVSAGGKKSYICTLGTLIWNQDKPCEQDTPMRDEMFKLYKANAPIAGRDSPVGMARPSKTNANLSQLVNYPEEYLRQTVQLENLWLYGNIVRSRNSALPSDKSSVVIIQDKFARKVAVALDNSIGLRFADQLQPDRVYPVDEVLISVQSLGNGYLPYIKGLKFGTGKPKLVKVNFKHAPNPIIGPADGERIKQNQDTAQDFEELSPDFAQAPQDGSLAEGMAKSAKGPDTEAILPQLQLGAGGQPAAEEQNSLEQREQNYDPKIFGQRHYSNSQ